MSARGLVLHLDEDDVVVLRWLGLPLDAEPVEVARAVVHVAIDAYRESGSQGADPLIHAAVARLRDLDTAPGEG